MESNPADPENISFRKQREREDLLKRFFDFDWTVGGRRERVLEWLDLDPTLSASACAELITEDQLKDIFLNCGAYSLQDYLGEFYTVIDGDFKIQGSWNTIRERILS